jgi:hypothetical protein
MTAEGGPAPQDVSCKIRRKCALQSWMKFQFCIEALNGGSLTSKRQSRIG